MRKKFSQNGFVYHILFEAIECKNDDVANPISCFHRILMLYTKNIFSSFLFVLFDSAITQEMAQLLYTFIYSKICVILFEREYGFSSKYANKTKKYWNQNIIALLLIYQNTQAQNSDYIRIENISMRNSIHSSYNLWRLQIYKLNM